MNAAIVLSGGIGSRLGGDIPKQYLKVKGRTILSYCMESISKSSSIDVYVIVCDSSWRDAISESIKLSKPMLYTDPGETRQLSIYSGLRTLYAVYGYNIDNVLVHDAARPLTPIFLFEQCLEECKDSYSGVMPVIPMKDTIYQSNDGIEVHNLLDRSTLYAGQAPEVFKFSEYLEAHQNLSYEELMKINGSSELAFRGGMKIRMIAGDPMNFKITDKSDLNRFKNIIESMK